MLPGLIGLAFVFAGCGNSDKEKPNTASDQTAVPAMKYTAQQIVQNQEIIEKRLREDNPEYKGGAQFAINPQFGLVGQINLNTVTNISALKGIPFGALDLRKTPISDLSPLAGMPLTMLGLENTHVSDLSPLRGLEIKKLYLNDTPVSDIGPLAGMPLEELMLVNTRISSVAPLKGAPLKMLWLNNTEVSDIAPLADSPLISLTLEGTKVSDISPLAKHPTLQRLHISNTPVKDLTPIRDINLRRLIFLPENITNGIDIVRTKTSLREIGTTFDNRCSPEEFWKNYPLEKQKK
jgi:hypothetical protein